MKVFDRQNSLVPLITFTVQLTTDQRRYSLHATLISWTPCSFRMMKTVNCCAFLQFETLLIQSRNSNFERFTLVYEKNEDPHASRNVELSSCIVFIDVCHPAHNRICQTSISAASLILVSCTISSADDNTLVQLTDFNCVTALNNQTIRFSSMPPSFEFMNLRGT